MLEEMNGLYKNCTYELVELSKEKKIVSCKWVFTVKFHSNETWERRKARVMAKGYV